MMNKRQWYLSAGACLTVTIVLAGCAAWLSREGPPVLDAAGQTEQEVMTRSVRQQFESVKERYGIFNDLIAETQREFYAGEWIDSGSTNAQMTLRGNAFSGALQGEATDTNSYYLTKFWRLEDVHDAETRMDQVKEFWEQNGWNTTKHESDINPGEFEITGTSPTGDLVMLDMIRGGISLKAYTGVYWGDRDALAVAIWNIQQTERNEGVQWRPTKVNAEGHGLIRPGEYPPFPEWRSVALEERLEKSSRGAE